MRDNIIGYQNTRIASIHTPCDNCPKQSCCTKHRNQSISENNKELVKKIEGQLGRLENSNMLTIRDDRWEYIKKDLEAK